MEKEFSQEEVQKAVEEYVENLELIKGNQDFLDEAFYVETGNYEAAETAKEAIEEAKEELKALEEKFGSEIAEKAEEQFEANKFVENADKSLLSSNSFEDIVENKETYQYSTAEEKVEQILEKFDSKAEQISDESLAKAFNEKFDTDFSADQIKELKEEIEVAKTVEETYSRDNSAELSL